jgi:hypothetical protein
MLQLNVKLNVPWIKRMEFQQNQMNENENEKPRKREESNIRLVVIVIQAIAIIVVGIIEKRNRMGTVVQRERTRKMTKVTLMALKRENEMVIERENQGIVRENEIARREIMTREREKEIVLHAGIPIVMMERKASVSQVKREIERDQAKAMRA